MKKLLLLLTLLFSTIIYSQSLGYNDLGILFSGDEYNGTARYNAMSGAFGALGGDLSAIAINPAGAAVFLKNEFNFSLSNRNTSISSSFYNNRELSENDYFDLPQMGGVVVFNNYNPKGNWKNLALGFNYSKSTDFENNWIARGNSDYATYIFDQVNTNIEYLNVDEQVFGNFTEGTNDKFTFSIASQYSDDLYVGFSINSYNLDFYQKAVLEEYNNDGAGNTIDASLIQELFTVGDGVSFGFGFISKPTDNIRFGLSYQSPVWYELAEEFVEEDLELKYSNTSQVYTTYSGVNRFDYKLRTPSTVTGSFAYIFNKQGLISLDYVYKNYSGIRLSSDDFSSENQYFKDNLKSVGRLNLGAEWRFDNLSLRAGLHNEKSPFEGASNDENIEGFSLGAGYNFGAFKFDVSYSKTDQTKYYDFYPQYNQIDAANLATENAKVTATLTIRL
ncbi:MAG TPA: outer membrane protein transport protein [Flavobacteriaceae bacterium]|nr:outer membrane protein transport protein [Flavobacteriaceae bacterium]